MEKLMFGHLSLVQKTTYRLFIAGIKFLKKVIWTKEKQTM